MHVTSLLSTYFGFFSFHLWTPLKNSSEFEYHPLMFSNAKCTLQNYSSRSDIHNYMKQGKPKCQQFLGILRTMAQIRSFIENLEPTPDAVKGFQRSMTFVRCGQ